MEPQSINLVYSFLVEAAIADDDLMVAFNHLLDCAFSSESIIMVPAM